MVHAGSSIRMSGGRPVGTTAAAGYSVGMSTGRPEGTTVGRCTNSAIDFSGYDLPTDWDVTSSVFNINDDLRTKLSQEINMQRALDQQALTKRICWQCGRVLWGECPTKGTYMIDPPKGVLAKDAPTNAFLKSVDNCFLTFEHDGMKHKWYSCSYCKSNQMAAEWYVGDILDSLETMTMKPVKLWDMSKPRPIAELRNRYETGHVSLCGHSSTTVKKASISQYQHIIGEVNSITKLDRHFHGMFGFLAVKEDDTRGPTLPKKCTRFRNLWISRKILGFL